MDCNGALPVQLFPLKKQKQLQQKSACLQHSKRHIPIEYKNAKKQTKQHAFTQGYKQQSEKKIMFSLQALQFVRRSFTSLSKL